MKKDKVLVFKQSYDLEKIKQLEAALLEYVERYGLTQSAREALAQLEQIQTEQKPKLSGSSLWS